jgi:glucokinase
LESYNCCLAADIGGTNIRVALISEDLTIRKKLKEPSSQDPLAILTKLIDSLLLDSSGNANIVGIGLAVAGIIDKSSGIILRAPNISRLAGFDIKHVIQDRFCIPVAVENDANAAAFGEKVAGAGREYDNFILVTLGTGIGGGIVMDNNLLSVAAEIGHMTINKSGIPCGCGNTGCLEAYASASGIIKNALSALEKGTTSTLSHKHGINNGKITAEDIYKAAKEGDTLAGTLLLDAGKALGIGMANIINILSPQAIILAGGLTGAWDIYIDAAIREASKRALPEVFRNVQIIPSLLGDDAGALGISALVFNQNKMKSNGTI